MTAANSDVLLHWHNLANVDEGKRVGLTSVKAHPQYNPSTLSNDVCVLTLKESVSFAPVSLDDGSLSLDGEVLTVAGWGNTSPSGSKFPDKAQEVGVPFVSQSRCNASDSYAGRITPGMLCAGVDAGGKDSCQVICQESVLTWAG
jgi:trypsin